MGRVSGLAEQAIFVRGGVFMHEIPKRFRSEYTDRLVNFTQALGDMMIQMELEFHSHLDIDRLARALALALDAEPILGCRFVKRWWRPHWERLDGAGRDVLLLAADAPEYEGFKHSSIDACAGPQIKACLLRSAEGDRLLIKVAHEVADAAGVRDIVRTISTTYGRLAREPGYRPPPNVNADRGLSQLMRLIPWHHYPGILRYYFGEYLIPVCYPLGSLHLPIDKDHDRTLEYAGRSLPADLYQGIREYGRQRGSTINDVMLASLFHAVAAASGWDRRARLRFHVTVDLRRFLPGAMAPGVCNLSGLELMNLGTDLTDDFDYTLERVSTFMRRRKKSWIGVNDLATVAPSSVLMPDSLLRKSIVSSCQWVYNHRWPYVVTNLGSIEPGDVTFDAPPAAARVLPPIEYPPAIIFSFSSYRDSLDLRVGTWPCSKGPIEDCLDQLVGVLGGLSSASPAGEPASAAAA